jgi:hypothetical protein
MLLIVKELTLKNLEMKKTVLIILGLIILSSAVIAQALTEKRFNISVSWSPKLYYDRISDESLLIDYSLVGTSLIGEYFLTKKLSIYSGLQFDNKKNAESIMVKVGSNIDYSLSVDRISSIPLGLKYNFTKLDKNLSVYSKGGLKYSRVLYSMRDFPFYDGVSGSSTGMDNILMLNLGIGSSIKINNSVAPFFEIEYARFVVGSNSGVSIFNTNLGLSFSF